MDQQRVKSDTTAIQISVDQLKQLLPLLPKETIVVLDRGYDANWQWCQCCGLDVNVFASKGNAAFTDQLPSLLGNVEHLAVTGTVCKLASQTRMGVLMDTTKEPMPKGALSR